MKNTSKINTITDDNFKASSCFVKRGERMVKRSGQNSEIAGGKRKKLIAHEESKKKDVEKMIFPILAVMKKQKAEINVIAVERRAQLTYFTLII